MNLEEIKHLFVPVSESKERNKIYLVIDVNEKITYSEITKGWDGLFYNDTGHQVTHFLDLDLLTTKSKAIELAESVFFEVSDYDKRKAIDKGVKLL